MERREKREKREFKKAGRALLVALRRTLILGLMQLLQVHDFLADLAKSPVIFLLLAPLCCLENSLVVLGKNGSARVRYLARSVGM